MLLLTHQEQSSEHFTYQDLSKFTMDQLVERTYYYVFQVPDKINRRNQVL